MVKIGSSYTPTTKQKMKGTDAPTRTNTKRTKKETSRPTQKSRE